jgi:uncharacterized protein YcbK (DUF882 family)
MERYIKFNCRCGCDIPPELEENKNNYLDQLEIIEKELNQELDISSGYRCKKHNSTIPNSAKNSYHTKCMAGDLKTKGLKPIDLYKVIDRLMNEGKILKGGIGVYNTFIHYDIRGTKIRFK